MYRQSKYVLALLLGTSQAYKIETLSWAEQDNDIPVEKLEHANTAGSAITRSNVAPLKNGSHRNSVSKRPELDENKVESSKDLPKDDVAGTKSDESPASLIQQFTYTESQGLDVNSDVAAVIDNATKASRPTQRSSEAYSGNGSASNAFKRPDLDTQPAKEAVSEKPKSQEPATKGTMLSEEEMSIADAAKELSSFGLIQTDSEDGVWRTAFYGQRPVHFFQHANGDISSASPWLHEVWSEQTEPLTVWSTRKGDPGRDASLKYKYDPNIPAPRGASKPKASAAAAAPPKEVVAKQLAPKAVLSQLDLDIDTTLSHKFQSFFQQNRNGQNERKDIAEKDIDQWVYDNTDPSVNPLPLGRTNIAPKSDQYWLNPAAPTAASPKLGSKGPAKVASGLPKELGGLVQIKDNWDSHVDHRHWNNLNDPSTVGMYDDQTVYSEAGKAGKIFVGTKPGKKAKEQSLAQNMDNWDSDRDHRHWANLNDPSTVGMYDDQTVYNQPGQAGKKFGGPSQKNSKSKEESKLMQIFRNDKDIGERMIDPAVYGFTNPLVERLPYGRKDSAPARDSYTPPQAGDQPTGAVWHKAYAQRQNYPSYAQVQDFGGKHITKAELDALIMNDQDRSNKAYDYNGVANPASKNYRSLAQFSNEGGVASPTLNLSGAGFDQNPSLTSNEGGWLNHLESFNNNQGHWVDSKKIDERVEEFVNRNVHESLDANWPRSATANEANGYKNPASGYGWVNPDAAVATPEAAAVASALYQRHQQW